MRCSTAEGNTCTIIVITTDRYQVVPERYVIIIIVSPP